MAQYSITGYSRLIGDQVRTDAYYTALRRVIKPGDVVLDLGAGTGIFSLLACRLGARQVYAVEPDDAIHLAKSIAVASGWASKIEFIQDFSNKIALPERADVLVSDLRGVLPPLRQHIPSLVDARRRLLAPGGILIPQRDVLQVAVVEAPEIYRRHSVPWGDNDYGFNMEPARRLLVNTWRKEYLKPEHILLPAQVWAVLDYPTVSEPNVSGEAQWTVERAGTAHGLAVWFDALLADGVQFSNAPGNSELIYGNGFFPWEQAVELVPGDTVSIRIQARLVGDDYIWLWEALALEAGQPSRVKAKYRQSTFFGAPLAPAGLRKQEAGYIPCLGAVGQLNQFVLSQMTGTVTLEEIARQVVERFPASFANYGKALSYAGELAQKYST